MKPWLARLAARRWLTNRPLPNTTKLHLRAIALADQTSLRWSRLLGGEFRDPLVGRDVLAGALLGLGHTAAAYSATLLAQIGCLERTCLSSGTPEPGQFQRLAGSILTVSGAKRFWRAGAAISLVAALPFSEKAMGRCFDHVVDHRDR